MAPLYAVRIVPGSLGTFAGLKTDEHARVLDSRGAPIGGLYAAGNDMNSIMGGHYPGGGITLGPAMTFGWIAARHIAAQTSEQPEDAHANAPMSQPDPGAPPEEVDLLVFGGGAGGMTAALVASLEGLDVLLCEKTGQVGGTTATSGGTAWVPGTDLSVRAGVPDSAEDAAAFLASVVGQRGGEAQRRAFLESGPAAIRELEQHTEAKFVAATAHPDYLGNHPGAAFGGRALAPLPFDGRRLGRDFARVRPPRPEFLGPTGMMVARNELDALLRPFSNFANFRTATGLLLRQAADRLRYPRGTRLVMGNALVARLFYSLRQRNTPIRFDTALSELIVEQGRVVGAVVQGPTGEQRIRARYGVVLATGGIAHHHALRARLFPRSATRSLAPDGNTGDGIDAAARIGAPVDTGATVRRCGCRHRS
jgi:succinate dehydrogenase/fumarate reductase flavoprotein subunit